MNFGFFKTRKFRHGAFATSVTMLVVVLVIAINIVLSIVNKKTPLKLDLTQNKFFEITQQSVDFLGGLEKEINIYVLNTEEAFTMNGEYSVQANEVIKQYSTKSDKVTVKYVDVVKDPTFVSKYPDLQLSANSILITSGTQSTTLTPYDLFDIQSDTYGNTVITSSKAEQAMTSALLNVTSDKKMLVTFLNGHDEEDPAGISGLFTTNNYTVVSQNLLTETVNPAADIAVIVSPARDFTQDELKKLDTFLNNDGKLGKNLLYFASSKQGELPVLDAFLADWGIAVGQSVVFETDTTQIMPGSAFMTIAQYGEQVYSEKFLAKQLPTLIPFSRPIELLFETNSSRTTSALLLFSQKSGVIPPDAPEDWSPQPEDITGPIPALVLSQETKYDGTTPLTSTVLVCGSSMAIDPQILQTPSLANSGYILNIANTLSGREDTVTIDPKVSGTGQLGITGAQAFAIALVLVALLPLALLIFGIVAWLRRRHR